MDGQRDAAEWGSFVSIDMNLCAATTQMASCRSAVLCAGRKATCPLLAHALGGVSTTSRVAQVRKKSRRVSTHLAKALRHESLHYVRAQNLSPRAQREWIAGQTCTSRTVCLPLGRTFVDQPLLWPTANTFPVSSDTGQRECLRHMLPLARTRWTFSR